MKSQLTIQSRTGTRSDFLLGTVYYHFGKTHMVSMPTVEEAAQRIIRVVKDRDLRERLGQRAREAVKQKFLLTRYPEQYLDLFNSFETVFRLTNAMKIHQ